MWPHGSAYLYTSVMPRVVSVPLPPSLPSFLPPSHPSAFRTRSSRGDLIGNEQLLLARRRRQTAEDARPSSHVHACSLVNTSDDKYKYRAEFILRSFDVSDVSSLSNICFVYGRGVLFSRISTREFSRRAREDREENKEGRKVDEVRSERERAT